jgi:phage gpG-like protein
MAVKFQLIITGPADAPAEELELIAKRAGNAKPAMKAIQAMELAAEAEAFATGGASTGRSWKADTKRWQERKAKEGASTKPERYTDALMRSLTVEGGEFAGEIRKITKTSSILGTRIYYAAFQKRPILAQLRFTPGVVATAQQILYDWLINGEVAGA